MPWRLSGLLKINKETSTSVNHLKRLDNNEHRINQRIVLIAVTVLIVLRVGKIALVRGFLKEKYFYSKYRVRSFFYHLQDHEKITHLKML